MVYAIAIMLVPVYIVKFRQLWSEGDLEFLQKAVGHPSTLMASLTAQDWHKLLNIPWQELACLGVYVTFFIWLEATEIAHGVSEDAHSDEDADTTTQAAKNATPPAPATDSITPPPATAPTPNKRPTTAWRTRLATISWEHIGLSTFLFLYVGTAALCERSETGTISATKEILSAVKDAGLVLSLVYVVQTAKIMGGSLRQNGMVVSSELARAINCMITSLVGLPLCFASWFPILALPGVRIAIRWWFTREREKQIPPEVHLGDLDERQTILPS